MPLPTSVFLEFLEEGMPPEADAPVLLDELEVGRVYEPVITSFYGMPYLRMRHGDLLRVVGRNDHGIPLFEFQSRADDIIDLGSIARIDTRTLKEALEMVGVNHGHWQARKENVGGRPVMCIYIADTTPERAEELRHQLHRALGRVDHHYREAAYTLGYPILQVRAAALDAKTGISTAVS